jgi:hypothetical protein
VIMVSDVVLNSGWTVAHVGPSSHKMYVQSSDSTSAAAWGRMGTCTIALPHVFARSITGNLHAITTDRCLTTD